MTFSIFGIIVRKEQLCPAQFCNPMVLQTSWKRPDQDPRLKRAMRTHEMSFRLHDLCGFCKISGSPFWQRHFNNLYDIHYGEDYRIP